MTRRTPLPEVLPRGTARPEYPNDPLPAWVTELREHQVTAVREIVEAFESGADVVFLDAPVGAGKTLIGELVRRELGVARGLYICTDRALQDQFVADFTDSRVLKGRANYIPELARGDVTCDDCTRVERDDPCNWCTFPEDCPYTLARFDALGAKGEGGEWIGGASTAVLNTAYALTAANYAQTMRRYELAVADECDMLESALLGFVEFTVPEWIGRRLNLTYPKKGARKPTLIAWLKDTAQVAGEEAKRLRASGQLEPKKVRQITSLASECITVARALQQDVDAAAAHEDDDSDTEYAGRWIRDYGNDRWPVRTLKLRPVMVNAHGSRLLWRHAKKWLCMSGTVVSADELADSLGLVGDFATVTVPSVFPVENRPIVLAPVANVTAKMTERERDALVLAIERICAEHEGRVLVHTVSYKLSDDLFREVQVGRGRKKVRYQKANEKATALEAYKSHPGAVMFAPSMDRGVDLAGDLCAVQIIAKVPFPNLGDKVTSSRLRLPGGQQWYAVQAIRDVVQMTGRGVRSKDDTCTTYILDQQFTRNLWRRNRELFPQYFREAIDERADIRWML